MLETNALGYFIQLVVLLHRLHSLFYGTVNNLSKSVGKKITDLELATFN